MRSMCSNRWARITHRISSMNKFIGILTFFMLLTMLPSLAAEKSSDKPDPEMLRMLEVLQDWEMFKNMQLLKEMQRIDKGPNPPAVSTQNVPLKQKEIAK